MYKEAIRPAWAEINLSNLEYNVKNIKSKVGDNTELIGVIKADAYGHGSVQCAQVLRECGVKTFAIATLPEAVTLRQAGATENIISLGLTPDLYVDTLVDYDISPLVDSYENVKAINEAAAKKDKIVNVIIAVDTGMGRIGYLADDAETAIKEISEMQKLPNIKIKGMISHFATADAVTLDYAHGQEAKYNAFYNALKDAGIEIPSRTLANSAAIMRMPEVHFEAARPGIILYGGYPSTDVDTSLLDIKPVMSIKANIVKIKTIPAGASVSYGRIFTASEPTPVATIPIGYADGFPRTYSTKGSMIVNGVLCPIIGRICMDQCMIDVSKVPDVKVGDEVIIMGSDGNYSISAEDIGEAIGTINYEIMCRFGMRLPKIYVKEEE